MKLGIKQNMALSVSVFLVTLFSLSTWVVVSYTTRMTSENIQKQQYAMTEMIARSIDDKLGVNLVNLSDAATDISPGIFANPAAARDLLRHHDRYRKIFDRGLSLVDRNGRIIARSDTPPDRHETVPDALNKFLKYVKENDLPDISPPYTEVTDREPVIAMAVPISTTDGYVEGFLVGSITLTKDYFIEEMMNYKIGSKGYLYLFLKDRTLVIHPDKGRRMTKVAKGSNLLLDKATEGFEGSGETVNSRGVKQIASFKRLRTTEWILASAFPQTEAYAPVRKMRNYLIATSAFFVIFSIAFIWALAARITLNLNIFTRQVQLISSNSTHVHKISLDADDEISVLAGAFNQMMEQLDNANKSLEMTTRTDFLTGLYNRRHLEYEAARVVNLSVRQHAKTALLMVDIDHFKRVNDTYGHETGDLVLVHLAGLLRQDVRPYDLVIRMGGEEFLLLLPMISDDDALNVAERLRSRVEESRVVAGDTTLAITVSIGLYVSENMADLHQAVARGDAALYEAKRTGRNRVHRALHDEEACG